MGLARNYLCRQAARSVKIVCIGMQCENAYTALLLLLNKILSVALKHCVFMHYTRK